MVLRFLLINTLIFTSFIFSQESRRDFDAELDYQSEAINNKTALMAVSQRQHEVAGSQNFLNIIHVLI